jgi:histidine ammonia-lyase
MIVLDGAGLTPAHVTAVARGGEQVRLSDAARERNAAAREAIAALLHRGEALYGATTGVGALRDREIGDGDRERFQWNLLRSHAVGAGWPLPPELVRAAMVVRANQLGAGGAGVATELLDALVEALNAGLVPIVWELGSLGTGDLSALSEIALALLGEGRVLAGGHTEAVAPPRIPVTLGLRDALGFISSNALSVGRAALLSVDGRALQEAWLAVAALSFEALQADTIVLDARVQAGRGSPAQTAVAARMRELLAPTSPVRPATGRLVQDPYPFRVLPQVDGVSWGALSALEQVLARELNARCENALIDDGSAWPTGNFHAAELAAQLDGLRAALAQSATLIAARVSALLDPRMSGLPPFLAYRPGRDSGMMMLEYTAHEAASEARSLTMPMATQSVSASLGVESHASLATISARRTAEVLRVLEPLVATELVVAVRALRLAGRTPVGAGTTRLFELASDVLPAGFEDRMLGTDVEAACGVLARWSLGLDVLAEVEAGALGHPSGAE